MRTYALVGKPLSHSFSQKYFREKFATLGIEADYLLKELPTLCHIREMIVRMPTLQGFNVTMPYKKDILKYLDTTDNVAKQCGNVNCVKVIRAGEGIQLKGYNTDLYGFSTALKERFDLSSVERAVILGSGSVSQTIAFALKQMGIDYKIATRQTPSDDTCISYERLNSSLGDYQLIINSTPCGMHPLENQIPPIDCNKLQSWHKVFDLIYNPETTPLLQIARQKGCETTNGYRMLVLQAEQSWQIWQTDKEK